jgi:hypothetical protein
MRKRQILENVRLLNDGNMLALQVLPHLFCFIKTKKLVGIVDEQVEMPEEASAQKPANLGVKGLNLRQALDNNQRPMHGEWANLDKVGTDQFRLRVIADGGDFDVALGLEPQFRRKRGLKDRNLRARVDEEFVWPGSVDGDGNSYLGVTDRVVSYGLNVPRTPSFP